ncbi:A disintegrin and metalloproteinase with thrombospondin motifs gon-1-like [Haliotis asinina]|uniref:A disintegrin and metalloproteinase with thrombospondin motifs gon-1-like n=1 Tax=Haliotis asinina TaxID=109174 RepID=UPI0035318CE8
MDPSLIEGLLKLGVDTKFQPMFQCKHDAETSRFVKILTGTSFKMEAVITLQSYFFLVICISITSSLEETHYKKWQSGAPAELGNPQHLQIQQVFTRTICAALCSYTSCKEFQHSDTSRLCITRHTDPVSGGVINPGIGLFDTYKQDPTTCAELRTANPAAHSGEYTIVPSAPQFRGMAVKVFCLMNDTHQLEYVTLPNENIGNFPKRSNNNCRKEQSHLVGDGVGLDGVTVYRKIRIIPSTMTVVRTDTTFTSGTKTKPHTYGRAEDCYSYSGTCKPIGTFRINTLGTGMKFAADLQWTAFGNKPKVHSITRTHDGAVIDLVCGGWCGRCDPVGDMILYPNSLDGQL